MRSVRSFMDYLLRFGVNERSEHQSHNYSSIYGKIIYPVAFNPLCNDGRNAYYKFNYDKNKYYFVR